MKPAQTLGKKILRFVDRFRRRISSTPSIGLVDSVSSKGNLTIFVSSSLFY